jgi:hypothetical protein
MERQVPRILAALLVIVGALSLPLAADSLTGGVAGGSAGSIGGNAGGGNAGPSVGGAVGSNVGTSVDSSIGNSSANGAVEGTVGGNVGSSMSGADANGAANSAANVDANGAARQDAVDAASSSVERSDDVVRSEYMDYSSRLDALDRRIDENVSNNVYTFEEAAEHRADLAALRARLRNREGQIRRLTMAQRNRLDSAIRDQEKSITVDVNSEDNSDTSSDVRQ